MSGAPSWKGRRLHFIGAGGAGMSGLALVAAGLGAEVSGSDRADSSYLDRVRRAGARVTVGHDPGNLPESAEVVVSTAISEDNPELAAARRLGRPVLHRSELLAELCASRRVIAVAGTHGKSTTTGMIAWAMRGMGLDPAFFLGGELPGMGAGAEAVNSGWGEGGWAVVEADESDGSFLRLRPEVAVITNVEMDHHSEWGSLAQLRRAFAEFGSRADRLIAGEGESWLEADAGRPVTGFDADSPGPRRLELAVPGRHNVLDARAALAAIAAAAELSTRGPGAGAPDRDPAEGPRRPGDDLAEAARALAGFPGVKRRLEYKGSTGSGARVYDDYAHHPTEVEASLSALREIGPGRLIAIFQPHLYSRTRALADDFGRALSIADEAIVMEVYPAREQPVGELAGVDGRMVARAAADHGGGGPVWWIPAADRVEAFLADRLAEGDTVVTLGAGDVTRLSDRLAEADESGSGPG